SPTIVETAAGLKMRSCLIDGEAVCCDENGLAVFALLRYRERPAEIFLYAFDLLELDGQGSTARAARDPQGDAGEPATLLRARATARRAPRARRRGRLPPRPPARPRGHRVEGPRLAACQRPHAAVAQV